MRNEHKDLTGLAIDIHVQGSSSQEVQISVKRAAVNEGLTYVTVTSH
jgi:hypothetical protein